MNKECKEQCACKNCLNEFSTCSDGCNLCSLLGIKEPVDKCSIEEVTK
jgi:hypothetical protein